MDSSRRGQRQQEGLVTSFHINPYSDYPYSCSVKWMAVYSLSTAGIFKEVMSLHFCPFLP